MSTNEKSRTMRVMHPLQVACLAHNLGITPQTWIRRHLPEGTRVDGIVVPPATLAQFLLPFLLDPGDSPRPAGEAVAPGLSAPDPRLTAVATRQVVAAAEALCDAWEIRDLTQGTRHLEALVRAVANLRRLDNRPTRHDA